MKHAPLALAVALSLLASPVVAQETSEDAVRALDRVVVTGTRVSDRTIAESTAPIDVITPETLTATGTVELATALSRAIPSLNFPRPAINDGTDAMRPAQLRGLAPDHALVLVNGKRFHPGALVNVNGSQGRGSSPVDLNAIPIAAIERVEVLRDGASALYGSDAIAGVVNIVLKGASAGGSVGARYGVYSAGDGEQHQLTADSGFGLGEDGFIHLFGQGGHQDQTDRARPYLGTVTPTSAPAGKVVQRQGDPEVDHVSAGYNAEFALDDIFTLYSYALAGKRESLSNGFFRAAGDARNIPEIYPNGFLPQIFNVSRDTSFQVGARASTENGTHLDFSYTYGRNKFSYDILNTLNRSLGPTSPTEFHAGALGIKQHVVNLGLDKLVGTGLEYPLTFSAGAEFRKDEFQQFAGEPLSYALGSFANLPGAQVFPGFKPSDGGKFDRNNSSLYAGLEGDLSEKFSFGLAARYENYSDFGTTTTGKVTGRYAFSDAVALRGTVSTGFHAPSLQQQYYQSTATNFIGGIPYDIVTFRVNHPAAIALGAEPLSAEESTNYSLGLVLQPTDGFYITIDAYQIKVTDRITLSENLTSTAVRDYLNAHGFPGVGGGRYFTNAIDTTTQGIDVVGTYTFGEAFDLTFGLNYNKTDIDAIAPNPSALEAIDPTAVRVGRTEIGRITDGAPKDKAFVSGVYSIGAFSISTTATRWGKFSVFQNNPELDQTFGAEYTLDLAFAYALDKWKFTVGGDNVLNAYPDEVLFANSTSGQLVYSGASPFGFNGGFIYANIGYEW
ncbi:MAG: TonB-dependent receptor [Lysobacteraceae bacterium]